MNPPDPLSAAPIGIPQACLRMIRLGAAMAAAAALSGCANFSPDGGMSVAAGIAAQELEKDTVAIRTPEDATSARTRVADLLRRPLTADAAVQIALLNNRGLQAAYNELGIAEAANLCFGLRAIEFEFCKFIFEVTLERQHKVLDGFLIMNF